MTVAKQPFVNPNYYCKRNDSSNINKKNTDDKCGDKQFINKKRNFNDNPSSQNMNLVNNKKQKMEK